MDCVYEEFVFIQITSYSSRVIKRIIIINDIFLYLHNTTRPKRNDIWLNLIYHFIFINRIYVCICNTY